MNVDELVREVKPAPCAVLDRLAVDHDRVRFRVRDTAGAWTAVTWGAFGRDIRAVACWLAANDFGPGDRAAIYAANSVAWMSAALGIQAAGGVMVPVYPASTAEQLAYVVGHSGARVVFVAGAEQRERVASAVRGVRVVALDGDTDNGAIGWPDVVAIDDPDLAARRIAAIDLDRPGLMLYTSGTSGPPKGVPLTHRNVGVNAADWARTFAPLVEERDRDLLWLPMSHIFGFGETCIGNALGWESWMATPADVLDLMPEVAPQVFMSVPAYWEKIARLVDERGLVAATGGQIRFALSGGAGLKVAIKEQLRDRGLVIIEGYGLTETSPTLTLNRPADYRFDSVGKPLPSVELRLADDGEILARGPSVFGGYHDDAAATRAAFTDDGWFKTGDVGRWTDDGFLQIVDRKKDILVTAGGKNVPPVNIESRFVGDPDIERVVVYGDGKPYLVAAVWMAAHVVPAEAESRAGARIAAVNAELAKFETIKRFFIAERPLSVEDGTLTTSLKLRRKAVYERYRERFEALYA
jgi:long-chain acyl-CoA synthetase